MADEMAPTPEALRSAARAAQRAGMDARAATHAAELLARESADQETRALAEEILRATEGGLARIQAQCEVDCRVLVDGRLATARPALLHVVYVRPGTRRLSASFEEQQGEEQVLDLVAGASMDLKFAPTEPAVTAPSLDGPAHQAREVHGISPWFFASAAVLTAASGAVTVWSSLKVKSAHDRYDPAETNAESEFKNGQRLERRTNILLGVTGGLALTTAITAFFTDFSGKSEREDGAQTALRGLPSLAARKRGVWVGWTMSLH